jgi:hypothetical protein
MWILVAEAGGALFLLVFIVWWTMFAGRKPDAKRPAQTRQDRPVQDDTPT